MKSQCMVCLSWKITWMSWTTIFFSSEELKEAVSVKSQSLQTLQDEKNRLTEELDDKRRDQSDVVKV